MESAQHAHAKVKGKGRGRANNSFTKDQLEELRKWDLQMTQWLDNQDRLNKKFTKKHTRWKQESAITILDTAEAFRGCVRPKPEEGTDNEESERDKREGELDHWSKVRQSIGRLL